MVRPEPPRSVSVAHRGLLVARNESWMADLDPSGAFMKVTLPNVACIYLYKTRCLMAAKRSDLRVI